ncbi:hypothetical protein NL676_029715 [Syzygium grande]|nr:hypothetical protein NL676_029715 [Syzygium grande]
MVQFMQNPVINSTPVTELTVEEQNLLSTSAAPGFSSIQERLFVTPNFAASNSIFVLIKGEPLLDTISLPPDRVRDLHPSDRLALVVGKQKNNMWSSSKCWI